MQIEWSVPVLRPTKFIGRRVFRYSWHIFQRRKGPRWISIEIIVHPTGENIRVLSRTPAPSARYWLSRDIPYKFTRKYLCSLSLSLSLSLSVSRRNANDLSSVVVVGYRARNTTFLTRVEFSVSCKVWISRAWDSRAKESLQTNCKLRNQTFNLSA